MLYAVTRQRYCFGENVVEIAIGGLDYTNPDTLVPKYKGEMKEYRDPRKAVEVAISICRAWRKDVGKRIIKVAIGDTCGCTMPFEGISFKAARRWAKDEYKRTAQRDTEESH